MNNVAIITLSASSVLYSVPKVKAFSASCFDIVFRSDAHKNLGATIPRRVSFNPIL